MGDSEHDAEFFASGFADDPLMGLMADPNAALDQQVCTPPPPALNDPAARRSAASHKLMGCSLCTRASPQTRLDLASISMSM